MPHHFLVTEKTCAQIAKNARKKLAEAQVDLKWATETGLDLTDNDYVTKMKASENRKNCESGCLEINKDLYDFSTLMRVLE